MFSQIDVESLPVANYWVVSPPFAFDFLSPCGGRRRNRGNKGNSSMLQSRPAFLEEKTTKRTRASRASQIFDIQFLSLKNKIFIRPYERISHSNPPKKTRHRITIVLSDRRVGIADRPTDPAEGVLPQKMSFHLPPAEKREKNMRKRRRRRLSFPLSETTIMWVGSNK